MDILIVIEDNNGKVHRMGLESITAAQTMAKDRGFSIAALVMGSNADGLATQVSNYDIGEVLKLEHDLLSSYSSDGYAEAVKQVVEKESPKYVFFGHTYQVRDYVPKISAKLMKPFLVDNVLMNSDGDDIVFTKQMQVTFHSCSQRLASVEDLAFSDAVRDWHQCSADAP